MAKRTKLAGAGLALALAGTQALAPAGSWARTPSAPTDSVAAKIVKQYPWAKPQFVLVTIYGKKQYNLVLYQVGKPVDLGDTIGARLMNLYVSGLKGQTVYTLTSYALSANAGAVTNWQYVYYPLTKQLTRFHFAQVHNVTTIWYLTPEQIAQAAKSGHWPKNGVTR